MSNAEPPMPASLERLWLTAVQTGWWADWRRYYDACEAVRQARLAALERDAR